MSDFQSSAPFSASITQFSCSATMISQARTLHYSNVLTFVGVMILICQSQVKSYFHGSWWFIRINSPVFPDYCE